MKKRNTGTNILPKTRHGWASTVPAGFPCGKRRLVGMDDLSTAWLRGKAEIAHTSVGQIINELVRKEIAAQSA